MEQKDKINRLLDMYEHPVNYTDEQLLALLNDESLAELQQRLSTAKRAMAVDELNDDSIPDADAEWKLFEQQHFTTRQNRLWFRAAAIIAGVLMLSAFTYAAIHAVRMHRQADNQPVTEQVEHGKTTVETQPSVNQLSTTDSIAAEASPVTFDNVALETIVGDIAAHHGLQVEFRNEDVRALRFYFVWQPGDELTNVLEHLNMFESVSISKEGNTIVVE